MCEDSMTAMVQSNELKVAQHHQQDIPKLELSIRHFAEEQLH